jgi:hypothetical protein
MIRVQVSDSSFLGALTDALVRGGCVPSKVDDETVEVTYPHAADAQARTELAFFLRAWQCTHPGVDLRLT